MSAGSPVQTRIGILPVDIYIPTDDKEIFHEVINERERDTATVVNQKENGIYPLQEVLNGQQWFTSDPSKFRGGFRHVYETGVLALGANNIPHNLTITNFTFTNVFGVITDGTSHIVLPNGNGGTGDSSNILIDGTNIVISITAGYVGFSGHITLEYVKEL